VVEAAVKRNLFRRAFKGAGAARPELAAEVDALLARSALGSLGLARKAGQLVSGAAKVDAELRAGRALALLQASDAAPDGRRKMEGARHAAIVAGKAGAIPVHRPFTADEMGLALGGVNVVHAAVLAGNAGSALLARLEALAVYRGDDPAQAERTADAGREQAESNDIDGCAGNGAPRTDQRLGTIPGQEVEA
jgi:uncharacterized protein